MTRELKFGMILTDAEGDEVLLPRKLLPKGTQTGQRLRVFVYKDSHGRPVATTQEPMILLHNFAYLRVKQVTSVGAFLDWGLEKDLMVPFGEQRQRMELGQRYLVYLYLDEITRRLVATAKFERFLSNEVLSVKEGDEVNLVIWNRTDLGVKVIINAVHQGLLYQNEIFKDLRKGDKVSGYVKMIREGNKIDVALQKDGVEAMDENATKLLEKLKNNRGFLPLNDKSDPEEIKEEMEMSKKAFKRALGNLYRKKLVRIEEIGVFLVVGSKDGP